MASRRVWTVGSLFVAAASLASAGSPAYTAIFENPLPLPPIATPYTSAVVDGQSIDFYEVTIEPFQKQVFPGLGPTNFVGYNGFAPGPTYYVQRGTQTVIRYHNNQTEASVTHLHGSSTHSPWDGYASDLIEPGYFKDYYYPNNQNARPLWYHDHANGLTSQNCFLGLTGAYIIYDPAEDGLGLPTGKYDVPLMLADKMYDSDGQLVSVSDEQVDFYGDIIEVSLVGVVNYEPWPLLEVEPRKYRLRLYNTGVSRPYELHIEQSNGDWVDFQVIASDAGLFGQPVTTNNLVLSNGERYEIVFDFSSFSGQNLTLKNTYTWDGVTAYDNTDLVMSFVVGSDVADWSSNDVPGTLNTAIAWPESHTEVDQTFRLSFGGDNHWTINGVSFDDVNNRVLAKPPQGTIERWQFVYASGPGVHPVHVHLVDFQVLSRTGGSRGVLPYEVAGLKDIVLVEPGETVDVLAYYGPWNGMYMFHCHNLVHEDHMMMAAFNVTGLAELGYQAQDLADPQDARFAAQGWSAGAFADSAIQSTLSFLGGLSAYNQQTQIMSDLAAYYSTDAMAATTTAAASSSAATVAATTTAEASPASSFSATQSAQRQGAQKWGSHAAAQTQASSSFGQHGSQPQGGQSWGGGGGGGGGHSNAHGQAWRG